MLSKLYNLLAAVSLATLLAGGGFVGLLAANGTLADRAAQLAQLLSGETDDATAADAQGATSQPASQPAEGRARSAEELRQQRLAEQMTRALAERAQRDLAAQRELLERALQHLITEEEQFDQSREAWLAQQDRLRNQNRDEGFEREVKLVTKLAPAQAKEHLVRTWQKHPADAVRLIKALSPSQAQRIFDQMRSAEELQLLHELLEQLRNQDIDELAPASGKTPGDA